MFTSLTYIVNGEELATDILYLNVPLNDLRTPTLDGYTFDGWYYDTSLTRAVEPADKLTRNTTLYAKMTPIESFLLPSRRPFLCHHQAGTSAALGQLYPLSQLSCPAL